LTATGLSPYIAANLEKSDGLAVANVYEKQKLDAAQFLEIL